MSMKRQGFVITHSLRTLLLGGFLFGLPCAAPTYAQSGGLTITSNPSGAEVTLKGETTVTGITPTTFNYPLIGTYKVEIRKSGYETYKSTIVLDPTRDFSLQAELRSRSAAKAAIRSVFIPGWGQRYSGQPGKGFFFNIAAAGSVAAFLIVDNDYQKKFDRFDASQAAYSKALSSGSSFSEIESTFNQLKNDQSKAYDAETTRRITIGAVAGIWALNVIDALLFFPEHRGTFTPRSVSILPDLNRGGVQLTLTHRW